MSEKNCSTCKFEKENAALKQRLTAHEDGPRAEGHTDKECSERLMMHWHDKSSRLESALLNVLRLSGAKGPFTPKLIAECAERALKGGQ